MAKANKTWQDLLEYAEERKNFGSKSLDFSPYFNSSKKYGYSQKEIWKTHSKQDGIAIYIKEDYELDGCFLYIAIIIAQVDGVSLHHLIIIGDFETVAQAREAEKALYDFIYAGYPPF